SERPGRGPGSVGPEHIVQFYEIDAYLMCSVARYVGAAIAAGDAAIVIATQTHREALDRCLSADDLDLEALQERGQLVTLDAAATLARLMVDGEPDAARFDGVVG